MSLIFSFFISCAMKPPVPLDKSNWKVSEMTMTEEEALKLIRQKHKFITLTYEQFHDPLFQSLKWTPNCLKQNHLGKIRNENSFILLHSVLYTGPEFRPGFCPDHTGARKSSFVMLYCKEKKLMIEVKCLEEDCGKVFWDKQC